VNDELPEGWKETTLKEICRSITDGDHQAPPKAATGVPFITISAINDGNLNLKKATRFVGENYFNKLQPERRPEFGDVLFSVTGSVGLAAFVNVSTPFVFQRHIAILKPDSSCVANKFIRHRIAASDIRLSGKKLPLERHSSPSHSVACANSSWPCPPSPSSTASSPRLRPCWPR